MLIGHAKRLVLEPWGSPQVDWDATMPSGLYRTFIGPVTILMPNSAAALAAIFGKTSVCQKPLTIRKGLSTIIGNGLITSEGEAHKVFHPEFYFWETAANSNLIPESKEVAQSNLSQRSHYGSELLVESSSHKKRDQRRPCQNWTWLL